MENVSSEQELLQLRNEGKISEAEYDQLHAAMQKSTNVDVAPTAPQADKTKPKRKLGITAFVLMLAGIFVPIVIFFICFAATGGGEVDVIFSVSLCALVLLEMAALGTGIGALADPFGKAATIGSSLILVTVLLLMT